ALESGAGVGVAAGFPISVSVPDSRGGCSALPNRQRRALTLRRPADLIPRPPLNEWSFSVPRGAPMADQTPKSYFEEKIARKLVEKPETSKAVNSIYEFNITGENGGVWTVDLTKEPGTVQAGPTGNAKCTVTCAANDF